MHEQPLESFVELDGFDVVVLADVIEHLDDPVAAVDRCAGLLRPGGALCVVTPDPSSPTARMAGRRWWGFVPAHTCLLPRATLRELLAARGLVISDDVPLVRSFAARRWARGLAERLGRAGAPVERLADALPRPAPRCACAPRRARDPAPTASTSERAPSRCCATAAAPPSSRRPAGLRGPRTIPEVAAEIPVDAADRALLVDDASHDDTAEVALAPRASTCSAIPRTAATAATRRPATRGPCSTAPTSS